MPDIFEGPFVFRDPVGGAAFELPSGDYRGPPLRVLERLFPETLRQMVRSFSGHMAGTPVGPTGADPWFYPTNPLSAGMGPEDNLAIKYGATYGAGMTPSPFATARATSRAMSSRVAEWLLGRMAFHQPELYRQLVEAAYDQPLGSQIVRGYRAEDAPLHLRPYAAQIQRPPITQSGVLPFPAVVPAPGSHAALPSVLANTGQLERRIAAMYDPYEQLRRATRPVSESGVVGASHVLGKPAPEVDPLTPEERDRLARGMREGRIWPTRGAHEWRDPVPPYPLDEMRKAYGMPQVGQRPRTFFSPPGRSPRLVRATAMAENPTNRRIQKFLKENLGKSSGFYGGAKIGTVAKGAGLAGLALLGLQLLRGNED